VNRVAASLLGLIVVAPAEAACHKFSYWAYPWPQRCPTIVTPARIIRGAQAPPPAINISLPTLTSIDWGETADERLRGMVALRIKLQGD
jgi:hypothetical protein